MKVLAHDRQGAGPALALLHPLGADRRVWDPIVDQLAGEREVIAIDMPGFGESPALNGDGPATPAALARVVGDFLDSLGLDGGWHVAGNSLGGWVALELAAEGRARSVTAIAPAGLWPRPLMPKRGIARTLAKAALPVLPAVLSSESRRRAVLAGTVGDGARVPADAAERLIRAYALAPGFDEANREMRASRFTRLEHVRVPVTFAWPDRDRLVARPAHLPPKVRNVELRDAGHVPMWDQPDAVASLLLSGSGG